MNYFVELLASFLAVVIVLTLHEFAHAYVAYKCGDPTPKFRGRLSLNPLRHFDPVGLICFALVGFGWAKPVPINPSNFKHYRKGLALTSCAGVVTNYLSAFLFFPIYCLTLMMPSIPFLTSFLQIFTLYLFSFSLSFCVFNLLPFYPLDGFNLLDSASRRKGKVIRFLRQYGYYILLFLIAESFICNLFVDYGIGVMDNFNLLGWFMKFAVNIVGWPIQALWSLVFRSFSTLGGLIPW